MASRYLYALTTTGEPPALDSPSHPGGWRFKVTAQLRADRDGVTVYTFRRKHRNDPWSCYKTFEPRVDRSKEARRKKAIEDSVKALRQAADNIEASIEDFRSGDAIDDNAYDALDAIAKIMPNGGWLRKKLDVDYLLESNACKTCGTELSPDGKCHDCKGAETCDDCGSEVGPFMDGLCPDCDRLAGQRACQVAPDTGNQDV